MGLGRGLLKLLLITFCALFLIAGVATAAVAIWTIADKVFISQIIGTDLFSIASYFLLIGGIIIIISSILGLVAVSQQLRLLIIIFFVLLLVIFLLLIIGAIMTVVFRGELEEKMVTAMKDTLTTKYGNPNSADKETTAAWDKVQTDLRCCSVNNKSWSIYRETAFFKTQDYLQGGQKKYVPESCCVYDLRMEGYTNLERCQSFQMGPPGNLETDINNEYMYDKGCYESAKTFLLEQSVVLVAIGFVFSLTMIGGLLLTIFFIRRIFLDEDEERRHRYTTEDVAQSEKENEKL